MDLNELAKNDLGFSRRLHKASIKRLGELLAQDEEALRLAGGIYDGATVLIAATDSRVLIVSKSLGSEQIVDVPYGKITTVSTGKSPKGWTLKIGTQGESIEIVRIGKNADQIAQIARNGGTL